MEQKKTLGQKIKDSFYLFKFGTKNRVHAQQPKDTKTWIIHALSELIGTIFISLGLAGLSIYVDGEKVIEHYLGHLIIVGFFAGFIIVGLCLFIFLRWSCDLNPAVTLTRWLNGTNTTPYALMKFTMQLIGAFIAAAIIYALGTSATKHGLHNEPIQALNAVKKDLVDSNEASLISGAVWIFFIELVMTAILLFPIFSPNIRDEYRDLLIMFIISLDVWMGILGGTAAINPARGLAQQLPSLIFQQKELAADPNLLASVQYGTVAMVLGSWLSPFLYLSVAGLTREFFNPMVVRIIKFKNNRSENMVSPNQNK